MDTRQLESLGDRMRTYELEDLVRMVAQQRDEFLPAVIQLAEEELKNRGYSEAAIAELRNWEEARALEYERLFERELAVIMEIDEADLHCHLCEAADIAATIPFGLSAVVGEVRDPEALLKSGLASLVAVPLLGLALVASGSRQVSETIPLRLRLCSECARIKRWLGAWNLAEEDYRRHPAWARAEAIGFATFVSGV
jgi:hypothetical protein